MLLLDRGQLETLRKYIDEPAAAPVQPRLFGGAPAGALMAPEERTRGWLPSTPSNAPVRFVCRWQCMSAVHDTTYKPRFSALL